MTTHPEDHVIDAIDALVDEQLTHAQDDYNAPYNEHCPRCDGEWHGLPNMYGCPGAYGRPEPPPGALWVISPSGTSTLTIGGQVVTDEHLRAMGFRDVGRIAE